MDRRERFEDPEEAMRVVQDGLQARIWTTLPCIVVSYDADKLTAVLQPAIMAQARDPQGNWGNVQITQLQDCPVQFPAGGQFLLTFPLQAGDEVLALIASRCIDAWWQNGGVQPQAELRMHDLSDGFCFPCVWSQPRKPSNVSISTAQLRTIDGSAYIELTSAGVVNIVAPGGFNVTAPTSHFEGQIVATDEITAKNVHTVSAHVHPGVASGSASTDPPTG